MLGKYGPSDVVLALALGAAFVGFRLARWSALTLPLAVAAPPVLLLSIAHQSLADTPIAFVVIIATLAIAALSLIHI